MYILGPPYSGIGATIRIGERFDVSRMRDFLSVSVRFCPFPFSIGPTILTRWETECLPYVEFFNVSMLKVVTADWETTGNLENPISNSWKWQFTNIHNEMRILDESMHFEPFYRLSNIQGLIF